METLLSARCGCAISITATSCMSCSSTTAKGAARLLHLHLRSSQDLSSVLIRTTTARTSAITRDKLSRNAKKCARVPLGVTRLTFAVDVHCEAVDLPIWATLHGMILTWCHIARHRRCVTTRFVLRNAILRCTTVPQQGAYCAALFGDCTRRRLLRMLRWGSHGRRSEYRLSA